MKETVEVSHATAWEIFRARSKEQARAVRHYFARRELETALANLLHSAKGHEGNGLPPGSALYCVLNEEATRLCAAYCERWHVSTDRLRADVPALELIRRQAMPVNQSRAMKALLITVVFLAASFLAGVAGGLVWLGFQLLGGGR